jgi:hypothetical protein
MHIVRRPHFDNTIIPLASPWILLLNVIERYGTLWQQQQRELMLVMGVVYLCGRIFSRLTPLLLLLLSDHTKL